MIEVYKKLPDSIIGAVFDMDDTLLNNQRGDDPAMNLHATARLTVVHEIGKARGIKELMQLTPQDNLQGFLTAKQHTLESGVWNILFNLGLVHHEDIDHDNELLKAIVQRKVALHRDILQAEATPVDGAPEFLEKLFALTNKLAIATGATRWEVDTFLATFNLDSYFDNRIVSKEDIAHPKPHPEPFELGAAKLGVPIESYKNVLAFEDDPKGIASARAAGLYAVGLTTRFNFSDFSASSHTPDMLADSYDEVARAIGLH